MRGNRTQSPLNFLVRLLGAAIFRCDFGGFAQTPSARREIARAGRVRVACGNLLEASAAPPEDQTHEGHTPPVRSDDVFVAPSTDGGATRAAPAKVAHDLAAAPDGRLDVTWFDADGNLAVMWRHSIEGARGRWIAIRASGAAEFGPATKLGEGSWQLNACPMDGGRIVAMGGGTLGAVWTRHGGIYFSRRESAETTLGQGKQPVAVVARDGRPLVVWQPGAGLVAWRGKPGLRRLRRPRTHRSHPFWRWLAIGASCSLTSAARRRRRPSSWSGSRPVQSLL